MFRGYNLLIEEGLLESYAEDGQPGSDAQQARVSALLSSFKDSKGRLIASKLTADWFPDIACQVFISHAHKDSQLAVQLAGFLKYQFKLDSFIDSSVWGHADDLLKLIDDEYCWQVDSETYNYRQRNRSTSHVYMMLSTALIKMINRCECVIFLNTPTSISSKDYIRGDVTESPWIYSEIAMTSLIQKRTPSEHRVLRKSVYTMDEAIQVQYDIDLGHLTRLSGRGLKQWMDRAKGTVGAEALDVLYETI